MAYSPRARRRVLVLFLGLAVLGVGLGTVATGVAWGPVPPVPGFFLGVMAAALGIVGVIWWFQVNRAEVVAEVAQRTVQFVYLPAPSRPERVTYVSRPDTVDAELRGMLAFHSTQNTEELRRYLDDEGGD